MAKFLIEAFASNSGKSLGYWAESNFDFVKDEDNASKFEKEEVGTEFERVKSIATERNWLVNLSITENN